MSAQRYDIAIAGGGPSGAAAAIVLAKTGRRVLLTDGGGDRGFKVGEGLPPSARSLLRDLGILDRVLADGHRPSPGTLAFWGADTPRANDFLYQLHGHGLQLDRSRFDSSLRETARDAGADILSPAHLRIETPADASTPHRLHLRAHRGGTHEIDATWLIDATGRPATLARRLGAKRIEYDALIAFHLCLRSDNDTDRDGRTWVEAVGHGWWYSVLLPSRERLVAFLSDADLVDRRALLTREGFWQALQGAPHLHAHCREHGYAPAPAPHGADASSSQLDMAAGEHWLAVGDAALTFDPLSSKGIANALYTGVQSALVILRSDRGDTEARARYTCHLDEIHRVYREQLRTIYAMETRWRHAPYWKRREGVAARDFDSGRPPDREAAVPRRASGGHV